MGTAGTSKTKLLLATVLVVVIVGGVAVGYFITQPTFTGMIMGTTDSVETCLDPARAWDYFGWEMIQSLSSGLIEYKPGAASGGVADIVPALATSWSLSSDNKSWTFNLRHNVTYEDGTEFNATHVKYTIDRGVSIWDDNGAFQGLDYKSVIKNVTVNSKYQVTFNLIKPYGPFLQFMTMQCNYMVDPKHAPFDAVVEYVEGNARASYPLGLGPYKLTNWIRVAGRDTQLILEANPDYWNASAGYPKETKIMVKMYADATGLDFAITSGQIDVAYRHLTVPQYDAIKTNANVKLWTGTGAFIQYVCFQERIYPWNISDVRRAVAAAIDRSEICSTVYLGQAQLLYSMIPNGMDYHKDAFLNKLGTTNITLAKELLASHGYTASNKLEVKIWYESSGHYPQSAELVQTIKSQLEATGVMTVTLNGLDWAAYKTQARTNKAADVYIYGWYPDYIDPDDYIQPFYDSLGCKWLATGYNNSYMDTLISWARFNVSASVRNTLYGQIQNLSVVDCPYVPVYQYSAFAVTKLNVHGVVLDITMSWRNWLLYRTT